MAVEQWRKELDSYLEDTLKANFQTFPERCFRGPDNEAQRDLLNSLHDYYLALAAGRVSIFKIF